VAAFARSIAHCIDKVPVDRVKQINDEADKTISPTILRAYQLHRKNDKRKPQHCCRHVCYGGSSSAVRVQGACSSTVYLMYKIRNRLCCQYNLIFQAHFLAVSMRNTGVKAADDQCRPPSAASKLLHQCSCSLRWQQEEAVDYNRRKESPLLDRALNIDSQSERSLKETNQIAAQSSTKDTTSLARLSRKFNIKTTNNFLFICIGFLSR
jgi:hypothetical protein